VEQSHRLELSSGGKRPDARIGAAIALVMCLGAGLGSAERATANSGPQIHTVCHEGCDYAQIQHALNASLTGDTVRIGQGVYPGKITIPTPGVIVEGAGRDETFITSVEPYSSTSLAVTINGVSDITIRDLTIDGTDGEDGVLFRDGIHWASVNGENGQPVRAENVTIERVSILNTARRAISVFPIGIKNTTIRDVIVDNVDASNTEGGVGGLAIVFNSAGTIENVSIRGAQTGITGTVDSGADAPLTVTGVTVTELSGQNSTFFNLGLSFNTFPNRAPVMTITGNTVVANVPRNSGLYLVAPGPGSVISDNTFILEGGLGYGIETGWSPAGGVTVERNVIRSGPGAVGILVTGAGKADHPIVVKDNVLRNSANSPMPVSDWRNWGILEGREVGILISADPRSSRTGDANHSTVAEVRGNDVSGYTNALGFFANQANTYSLTATATGNNLRASGAAAVYTTQESGSVRANRNRVVIESDASGRTPINAPGNVWGGARTPEEISQSTSGWFDFGDVADVPPIPVVSSSADVERLLDTLGLDRQAGRQSFAAEGSGAPNFDALNRGEPLRGRMTGWQGSGAETVDVWAYSTPQYLGSFPVESGDVVVSGLDLASLSLGSHTLLFVGQESGTLLSLPISLVEPGPTRPGRPSTSPKPAVQQPLVESLPQRTQLSPATRDIGEPKPDQVMEEPSGMGDSPNSDSEPPRVQETEPLPPESTEAPRESPLPWLTILVVFLIVGVIAGLAFLAAYLRRKRA
jgi:hypothetical protein